MRVAILNLALKLASIARARVRIKLAPIGQHDFREPHVMRPVSGRMPDQRDLVAGLYSVLVPAASDQRVWAAACLHSPALDLPAIVGHVHMKKYVGIGPLKA